MADTEKGWLEERLGFKNTLDWFLDRKVPRGVGWWYVLGSATLVVFIVLVVTGLFMLMNYSPSPDHAYDSIQYSMTQVPFGSLIRSIHFYAASAMIILVVLHLLRVYFMAAYKYPREVTWVLGALLLILVLGSSFTGYLLPWDQRAYWATNVASGIAGSIPWIGLWIQKVLLGGAQVGTLTLSRFFTFHVVVLPALIAVLIGLHVFFVVRQGISAPPGRLDLSPVPGKSKKEVYGEQYQASKEGGEPFFPNTIARDTIFSVIIVAVIFALAFVFPHVSEAPADPTSTTYNPTPAWYFLFLFQFLKLFPGSLEAVAAVLIPALFILLLIAVPFIDRGIGRFWSQRKPALIIGGIVVIGLAALEVGGALSTPTRPPSQTNQLAIAGEKVYTDVNCGYCHSINGVGGAIGPDLSNIASKLNPDQMAQYLRNPDLMVANTLHPKLQFTTQEINELVAYLSTLGATVSYTPQAHQFFAQYCSKCHAINGQGGTVGPNLSREGSLRSIDFLVSFITDPGTTTTSSSMPAFKNTLTAAQISDIAAYLYSLKGTATTTTTTTTSTPSTTPTSTPTTSPTSTPTTTTTPINASQFYKIYCTFCHGANRQGGEGPAITASAISGLSASQIATIISSGDNIMPGFSNWMTPEQINALANYLKSTP